VQSSEVKGTGVQRTIGVNFHPQGLLRVRTDELMCYNHVDKHSETKRQHLPDAAAIYCLKGKLWHAHDDAKKAVECYVEALKLNPFMWDAFIGLCDTGEPILRNSAGASLTFIRRQYPNTQHLQDDTRDAGRFGIVVQH